MTKLNEDFTGEQGEGKSWSRREREIQGALQRRRWPWSGIRLAKWGPDSHYSPPKRSLTQAKLAKAFSSPDSTLYNFQSLPQPFISTPVCSTCSKGRSYCSASLAATQPAERSSMLHLAIGGGKKIVFLCRPCCLIQFYHIFPAFNPHPKTFHFSVGMQQFNITFHIPV